MFFFTEVIETIQHDIHLHEKLRELIIEELTCLEEDSLDCLVEKNRNRQKLEKEIKDTNKVIISLISKSNVDSKDVDIKKEEVYLLMDELRESIKRTKNVVEEVIANIENKKEKNIKHQKTLKKGKMALNFYVR